MQSPERKWPASAPSTSVSRRAGQYTARPSILPRLASAAVLPPCGVPESRRLKRKIYIPMCQRPSAPSSLSTAISPGGKISPLRRKPDFSVVFKGYSDRAVHRLAGLAGIIALRTPVFSEAVDYDDLVKCLQGAEITGLFYGASCSLRCRSYDSQRNIYRTFAAPTLLQSPSKR